MGLVVRTVRSTFSASAAATYQKVGHITPRANWRVGRALDLPRGRGADCGFNNEGLMWLVLTAWLKLQTCTWIIHFFYRIPLLACMRGVIIVMSGGGRRGGGKEKITHKGRRGGGGGRCYKLHRIKKESEILIISPLLPPSKFKSGLDRRYHTRRRWWWELAHIFRHSSLLHCWGVEGGREEKLWEISFETDFHSSHSPNRRFKKKFISRKKNRLAQH